MKNWTVELPETVVVTGTASGLGKEISRQLLDCRVRVIGVDVGPAAEDAPDGYVHVQGSVSAQSTWDTVRDLLDPDSSLGYVGSAAVLKVGTLLDEDISTWRDSWETNVFGQILALRTLLPVMIEAPHAAVVAVSSIDADFGEQQLAAYASSKAAVSAALRTITLDYARTKVQFNVLAPGPMRAGLFERHLASAGDPDKFLATREARQPRGRITGVDQVANAALYLLSPASSALLGTTVTADGGLTTGFDFRTGAEGSSA
ncbi:SDR family oxidoreductase [Nocardioides sp. NBC_00850]|uniref:SDR family NAD(P)-dependent oxidoreductase n=1 Tax=Nocardioides sp. NBC_00850 TaxID=2976001 RepID=UPI003864272C|nr:SDR family oxidoreductase [Nocardioides sp. NBC_00850]